jgi:hypothetical protein
MHRLLRNEKGNGGGIIKLKRVTIVANEGDIRLIRVIVNRQVHKGYSRATISEFMRDALHHAVLRNLRFVPQRISKQMEKVRTGRPPRIEAR